MPLTGMCRAAGLHGRADDLVLPSMGHWDNLLINNPVVTANVRRRQKNGHFMTRLLAGGLVVCALALPAPADAFTGRRGVKVNPVDSVVFEVIARTAGSGADYWCGAAEYAQRALGAPWTATIFIARGRGPSVTTGRKSAVQFTLDPSAAGTSDDKRSWSLNALRAGDSMSVQSAYTYCERMPVRP